MHAARAKEPPRPLDWWQDAETAGPECLAPAFLLSSPQQRGRSESTVLSGVINDAGIMRKSAERSSSQDLCLRHMTWLIFTQRGIPPPVSRTRARTIVLTQFNASLLIDVARRIDHGKLGWPFLVHDVILQTATA